MLKGVLRHIRWMLQSKSEFRYTVLKWQPSLREEEIRNVAVIAEKEIGNLRLRLVIGRSPNTEGASDLGRRLVQDYLSWIENQVAEAEGESDDPLSYLANHTPYNLFFTAPKTEESRREFIEDAIRVFGREVLGDEALAFEALESHLRELRRHDPDTDPRIEIVGPVTSRPIQRPRARA